MSRAAVADALRETRVVGEVGPYKYLVGPQVRTRGRPEQWYAEEWRDGEARHRRRFASRELAEAAAERWANLRRLQQEHPL